MTQDWLTSSWETVGFVLLSTLLIFVAVLIATRITGLRSFSKMSSFDFAMTVAVGSVLASVSLLESVSVVRGVVALAGLYGFQVAVAWARVRVGASAVVDNTPIVLMAGTEMIDDHLRSVRVTRTDVNAKLREANVLRYDQVHAVVLETTGDVTVMHGEGPLDPGLLDGVRGAELVTR